MLIFVLHNGRFLSLRMINFSCKQSTGIAWLMEDVQNLTYATSGPNHKVKRSSRATSQLSELDTGSDGLTYSNLHLQRQLSAGSLRHPGIPPLRPSSRGSFDQSASSRQSARTSGIHSGRHSVDSTDGFLDEFSKLERAFRQRLALKGKKITM